MYYIEGDFVQGLCYVSPLCAECLYDQDAVDIQLPRRRQKALDSNAAAIPYFRPPHTMYFQY